MNASVDAIAESPPVEVRPSAPRAMAAWLLAVAAMVIAIIVVGGITRLTESGLSITEWKPVTGAIPPLSEAQWQSEFDSYRQIGEYRQVTGPAGMTLAEYKFIYFWEWLHRLIGRAIGLAFALPLAWFWIRRQIPDGCKLRLLALLALGALQGVFGWFMVRSGLNGTMTDVSHFWLSIHLMTALFTLAGLIWTALDLSRLHAISDARPARLKVAATIVGLVLAIQLLLGAWVAGLNAGYASNSWPLMQGRLIPEFDASRGAWWAMTHDPYLIHFLHRWWAWVTVVALIVFARRLRTFDRGASVAIHSAFGLQVVLGVAVVLSGMQLWLAVAHQFVGALLVASFAWGAHVLGRVR